MEGFVIFQMGPNFPEDQILVNALTVDSADNNWDAPYKTTATSWLKRPSDNKAPIVEAGDDQAFLLNASVNLEAQISDDGLPDNVLINTWSVLSGPGEVTFSDSASPVTTATFSEEGIYRLNLRVSDGELSTSDELIVGVATPSCPVE